MSHNGTQTDSNCYVRILAMLTDPAVCEFMATHMYTFSIIWNEFKGAGTLHCKFVVFVMLYLFLLSMQTLRFTYVTRRKAIATCSTCLAAGKLSWRCKNELIFDHRFVVCDCFLEFGMPAPRKIFVYSLQMSARRIVQSDFSILPSEDNSETVIVVRPRTTKTQKIKRLLCTILEKL